MSTTSEMKVDIDDRIRANPELLRAVTDATEYLRGLPTRMAPPAAVRWRYAGPVGDTVELSLSDDEVAGYPASTTARTPQFSDPDDRRYAARQAWQALLSVRLEQSRDRIEELWRIYEREEGNGAE